MAVHLPEVPSNTDKDMRNLLTAMRNKLKSGAGAAGPAGPAGPVGPAGPAGGSGTGSLVVSHSLAPAAAINVTTEGVKDWFAPGGAIQNPPRAGQNTHRKLFGGWIKDGFEYVVGGATTFTQASSFTVTSTAVDDASGSALAAVATDQGIFNTGLSTGFGYAIRVPADVAARTIKIYGSAFSADIQLTAKLSDGSVATVTDGFTLAASGFTTFSFTITYNASLNGQDLLLSLLVSVNHGSTPNLKFAAITMF